MATARAGFPGIPTPRTLELRPVQEAINNIRERFQGLETQLAQTIAIVGADTSAQALGVLQAQVTSLAAALNALSAQVADIDSSGASDLLAMDSKMRAIAQAYASRGPDDANSVIANRVFRA